MLPENSVRASLHSDALTDSPPGFPASNLGSNAKEMGKIKLFPTTEYSSKQPSDPVAPLVPCMGIFLGPSKSGKTVALISLILEQYRGVFKKIYIFSPSVNIDDGWIPVKKYIEGEHRAGADLLGQGGAAAHHPAAAQDHGGVQEVGNVVIDDFADAAVAQASRRPIPLLLEAAQPARAGRRHAGHSLPGLWITAGSKILEISGRTLHCLEDIPRVPGTSKPTWVRIVDPNNPYTSLSKSSQQCLTWLASCFRHSPIQPLARPRQLQALAAADACAEDEMVGIGGWAITSSQVVWFAKTWNMQDIRAVWRCLVKPFRAVRSRRGRVQQRARYAGTED